MSADGAERHGRCAGLQGRCPDSRCSVSSWVSRLGSLSRKSLETLTLAWVPLAVFRPFEFLNGYGREAWLKAQVLALLETLLKEAHEPALGGPRVVNAGKSVSLDVVARDAICVLVSAQSAVSAEFIPSRRPQASAGSGSWRVGEGIVRLVARDVVLALGLLAGRMRQAAIT